MKMYKMVVITILFLQILFGFLPTKTEAFTPCIESPGITCPESSGPSFYAPPPPSLWDKIFNISIPIAIGLLIVFISYKSFTKWRNLWGFGVFISLIFLSLILDLLQIKNQLINILVEPTSTHKIITDFLEGFGKPGQLYIPYALVTIVINALVFTLVGFILRKIYLKMGNKNNNIENGN